MKQSVKIIILAVVFIVLIVGGVFAYNSLSKNYTETEPASLSDSNETSKQSEVTEQQKNTAADFTVVDYNGKQTKLSDKMGKPVVVNFWASWCGPCKSEFPAFEKAYQQYGNDVEFMMVNLTDGYQETISTAKSYIDEQGYTFPVYYDTTMSASNAYGIYSIPKTLFIDKDGNIVQNRTGAMSEEVLEQNIKNLL